MSLIPDGNVKSSVDEMYRQYLRIETIEELYQQAVMMSLTLGWELSQRRHLLPDREGNNVDPVIYPPCDFKELDIDGSSVYQLSYQGMLPLYMKENSCKKQVRDYYIQATMEAAIEHEIPIIDSAFIYICHFFQNQIIRDLDNRNRSILINAVRYAGFIKDDSWKHIEIMESGFMDVERNNHVQVFITDSKNALKMIETIRKKYGE
ncbi:hypothetical protein ACIOBL_10040 [Paenibacillus taichungensis]|uniref:hypothetical protein n=1 Tax=Paenibacillus taichungensis TaxID=484184 RepID=UPI0038219E28